MQLSPEEARSALVAVQQVQERTHRTITWGAIYEVLWGTLWVIGFLISQCVPTNGSVLWWTWGGLGLLGGVISLSLGFYSSRRQPVRRTAGNWFDAPQSRFGLFLWAFLLYSGILFALFLPLLAHARQSAFQFGLQLSLWCTVTAMFVYTASGLWFRLPQLIGVGVAVTVIALLGYYLLPDYYYLLMAVFGGGTLIGHGLSWLHPWRR
jgi:hypothetical protein